MKKYCAALAAAVVLVVPGFPVGQMQIASVEASYHFANYLGAPPIHIFRSAQKSPSGLTPLEIKHIYNLPLTGGASSTIALVEAYSAPTLESDLGVFDDTYSLAPCTVKNKCLEIHSMGSGVAANGGWALETTLDVEWAHAIAPQAKILVVQAKTQSGANLLAALDYAAARSDVDAISISWGGPEFPEETSLDGHFLSASGAAFFASSGDHGAGTSWPAASPNVVAVGGTSLELLPSGSLVSESAWAGSGGGVSAYEPEPDYQRAYNIPKASGHRAIPDVAYNANPRSGYAVYKSNGATKNGWYVVGGTSAGAPQWAAIYAIGRSATLPVMYGDKASSGTLQYFRDIASGANGTCKYYCDARKRYDYVTGLGTPLTVHF
ncbi:MAG TPA: S53 family peptidase [Candidatus Paceibacterota bacterium]|nr:S53 family peptidase [Candidatus Paceibacterota bacterium]